MSNSLLFDRRYTLHIIPPAGEDARLIEGLHIKFNITKTLFGQPNIAEINIFNPNEDTIGLLKAKYTKVVLNAGYGNDLRIVFRGEVQNALQSKTSVDRMITVFARDGFRDYQQASFSKTFDSKVDMQSILMEVLGEFLDVVPGDLSGIPRVRDKPNGLTLDGQVSRILDDLAEEYNADWSIQDGVVNVLGRDNTLREDELVLISASTGMLGSPRVTEIGADVTALLNINLIPGARFAIQALGAEVQLGNLFYRTERVRTDATGLYKVRSVNIKGDSRDGNDWQSIIQGQRL